MFNAFSALFGKDGISGGSLSSLTCFVNDCSDLSLTIFGTINLREYVIITESWFCP